MNTLVTLRTLIVTHATEWADLELASLNFWHRDTARLLLLAFVLLSLLVLVVRAAIRRTAGRHRLVLPAIPSAMPASRGAFLVHAPIVLFAAGIPLLTLALADPYTRLISRQVSFPGRRICLMIDASTSMRRQFTAASLNPRSATDAAFYTTVAAAERFVRMRMSGKYRDLVALVEFGNEAYVVTPFTNDYDNILLSIGLIGDPVEFSMFPDPGTVIARAIEEGTALFRTFDFLKASGNLLVIFSDGEDTNVTIEGRPLDDILKSAVETKIPIYMVRTNYRAGHTIIPDEIWKAAVEKTGGKFYDASDEDSLLQAIDDIDRLGTGTIDVRQYTNQQPRYALFALLTAACWAAAAALKLGVPHLQKLP